MIGKSSVFQGVKENLIRFSRFDAPVLIEGETGTGKEIAARFLHSESPRSAGPFVPVNCGALPDSLIENELFGHCRGAYTDARTDTPGVVELAESGTLFLDEVDALTPKAQVALLRFLQDQHYRPLGSKQHKRANVRIVAANNQDLSALCDSGRFRQDLMFRIKVFYLRLPALRERKGDVQLLAEHFVETAAKRYGKRYCPLSPRTLEWLDHYGWPGNVRELENIICREFLLCDAHTVDIPPPSRISTNHTTLQNGFPSYREAKERAIAAFEAEYLERVMRHSMGNITAAAKLIGTERRHLGRLLKKYNVSKFCT